MKVLNHGRFAGKSAAPVAFAALMAITALAGLALPAGAETLRLKDGTVLQGDIVSRTDSVVVFRSELLGELRIPVSATERTAEAGQAKEPAREQAQVQAQSGDPADHALFFLPTAFTPPKGSFMFRDFELLFLTLGYAPTASTTVTGGFLFPISSDVQVLTAGIKQQVWAAPDGSSAAALTGNITNPVGELDDEIGLIVNGNLVAGWRAPTAPGGPADGIGLHAALGFVGAGGGDSDWGTRFSMGFGTELRITSHAKFMVEFLSAAPFTDDEDLDGGLLTLGIRLHGERLSADIAGIRPMVDSDMDGFAFWPLLTVNYRI